MENNNIEKNLKPVGKQETAQEKEAREKDAKIAEYVGLTTSEFFDNFLKENEENIENENFGPVRKNLTNEIKKLVVDTEKELGKEHAERLAGRFFYILKFYLSLEEKDEVKDLDIKSEIMVWLSQYILGEK